MVAIADVKGKKHVLAVGGDGVIADFEVAEEMIKHFIRKVTTRAASPNPRSSSACAVRLDRRSSAAPSRNRRSRGRQACSDRGADGGGDRRRLPVTEPDRLDGRRYRRRHDEVAVLSLGGIVYSRSVRVGGDKMDEAIIAYVRRNHNLLVGEARPRRIKKNRLGLPAGGRRRADHGDQGPRPDERRAKEITSSPANVRSRRSLAEPVGARSSRR